jgi:hypothetical protein
MDLGVTIATILNCFENDTKDTLSDKQSYQLSIATGLNESLATMRYMTVAHTLSLRRCSGSSCNESEYFIIALTSSFIKYSSS